MNKLLISTIIILTAIVLYQTFTSNEVFVCPDGTTTNDIMNCNLQQAVTVNQRTAETAITNYGNAQAAARGYQFTRVNVYREGPDYFAQTLFTNRITNNVAELKFKVDGRTASVECVEGCEFLAPQQTNQTQDI